MYKQEKIYSIVVTLYHLIVGSSFFIMGCISIKNKEHVEPLTYALLLIFFFLIVSLVRILINLFNKLITIDALKQISNTLRRQSVLVFVFTLGAGLVELFSLNNSIVFGNNPKIIGVILLILALVELTYIIYISVFIKKVSKITAGELKQV